MYKDKNSVLGPINRINFMNGIKVRTENPFQKLDSIGQIGLESNGSNGLYVIQKVNNSEYTHRHLQFIPAKNKWQSVYWFLLGMEYQLGQVVYGEENDV